MAQLLHGQLGDLSRHDVGVEKTSAHDSVLEVVGNDAVDRRIGNAANPRQRFGGHEALAAAVLRDRGVQNRASLRERSQPRQQLLHREVEQVIDRNCPSRVAELPLGEFPHRPRRAAPITTILVVSG